MLRKYIEKIISEYIVKCDKCNKLDFTSQMYRVPRMVDLWYSDFGSLNRRFRSGYICEVCHIERELDKAKRLVEESKGHELNNTNVNWVTCDYCDIKAKKPIKKASKKKGGKK